MFLESDTSSVRKEPSSENLGVGVVDEGNSSNQFQQKIEHIKVNLDSSKPEKIEYKIKLTESDKELLEKLDMEHRAKLIKQVEVEKSLLEEQLKHNKKYDQVGTVGEAMKEKEKLKQLETKETEHANVVSVPNPKSKLKVM